MFSFGSFLRKTGMDELPQLINILKGECSFVGLRPLLKRYLKINKFKNHVRAKCKPGITGLAQIEINTYKKKIIRNGLNNSCWMNIIAKILAVDLDRYLDRQNF